LHTKKADPNYKGQLHPEQNARTHGVQLDYIIFLNHEVCLICEFIKKYRQRTFLLMYLFGVTFCIVKTQKQLMVYNGK